MVDMDDVVGSLRLMHLMRKMVNIQGKHSRHKTHKYQSRSRSFLVLVLEVEDTYDSHSEQEIQMEGRRK